MDGDDQRLQIVLLSSPFELRTWRLFVPFLYHNLAAQSADKSTSGAVTFNEAWYSWGEMIVGLGMLRPPRRTVRESSSLSRSLIAVLPVMAGMRRCLIASSKGCRELVRWGMVCKVCPFVDETVCKGSI